ncbi:glycine betaine ABC transporter substrate-binding protein [Actinomadura alba]|uniref:Glycine betaine ABC transporter substrate-binding protein n=1 Tax=Actinomadura alba TaxID=406431 RepID=A0ABR7LQ01_9ACTN|nr:glycine betaine ABC transporter substrate-binding protein [Actinomadura alba]
MALSLTLAATVTSCGGDSGGDTGGSGSGSGSANKEITIGWVSGWDEDLVATYLWKRILQDRGYKVELKNLDTAPLYAGMAKGDVDVFLDTWLPVTHEDYWKRYGDKLEKLGVWYDSAKLTIAVPNYSDLKSLEDLKGKGGQYEGKIFGIEASSGLQRVSSTKMLPGYGIDKEFKVVPSSTAAMLAELKKATDAQKPIVVTLWRPHWAYASYPIRDLADPKGTMGQAEQINIVGRKDFGKDFAEVAGWLKKFRMDDKQLGSLEDLAINKYKGQEDKAVDEWLKANPDFVKSITG